MKNKQFLVNVMVVLALLGFVGSSIYIFFRAFGLLDGQGQLPVDHVEWLNPALVHITNALTGMVGGIVAAAFGTKGPEPPAPGPGSIHYHNLQNLGNLVYSPGKDPRGETMGAIQARFGFFYALAYILVGLAALVIWIVLGENTLMVVTNMATTFFGMMIPIVATYFKN